MTTAQAARLAVAIAGFIVTGLAISVVSGTGWILATLAAGFFLSAVLSERAFRALASREEVRRDLEERVRSED